MSKALKKLIDINGLREFKNKLIGTDSAYVQTAAVDQTIAGTKTFSKPIVGSVTGSSGSCTGNAATATKATQDSDGNQINTTYSKNGHTHDDRYYTEAEVNNLLAGKANSSHTHPYIPTSASCNKNWYWSGQGGQPSWLWGGEDGTNMYVYNPSNFSVNYANSAGYANWLRTSSHSDHLFHTEWDGGYFWTYVTAGDGGYRPVRVARSDSSGYADSAGNGVDSQDANWIRFKNGVQICWGYATTGFAFPKPFTAAPAVSLIHQTFTNRKILINVGAMDSRNCYFNAYDVEGEIFIDASVSYTAFGYWER